MNVARRLFDPAKEGEGRVRDRIRCAAADGVDVVLEEDREPLRECRRARHGGIRRRESREECRSEVVHVGAHDTDAWDALAVLRAAAALCQCLHLEYGVVLGGGVVTEPEVCGG